MNNRTEGTINSLAAILVIFTAMLEPRISIGIALVALVGLAIYKFRSRERE